MAAVRCRLGPFFWVRVDGRLIHKYRWDDDVFVGSSLYHQGSLLSHLEIFFIMVYNGLKWVIMI